MNIFNCSIFNKKKIYDYILKADIIIHLAAINGTVNFYNRPSEVFEVGARGSLVLHDILNSIYKKTKIKKDLLIASSGEVYGQPLYTPTDEKVPLKIDNKSDNNEEEVGPGPAPSPCKTLSPTGLPSVITAFITPFTFPIYVFLLTKHG